MVQSELRCGISVDLCTKHWRVRIARFSLRRRVKGVLWAEARGVPRCGCSVVASFSGEQGFRRNRACRSLFIHCVARCLADSLAPSRIHVCSTQWRTRSRKSYRCLPCLHSAIRLRHKRPSVRFPTSPSSITGGSAGTIHHLHQCPH